MKTLPFVVQPKKNIELIRVGNEEVGEIEVTRKGYLSVAEKAFVDNVMQGSDGVQSIVHLANRISKEQKTTSEKAYLVITDVMQGTVTSKLHEVVFDTYGEEISTVTGKMSESMARRAIAAATILIQTRVNHEWTIEDTLELDPILLNGFVELYDREERRDPVSQESREKEAADIVGK